MRIRFLLAATYASVLLLAGCKTPPEDNPYLPVREKLEVRPPSTPTPTPRAPLERPLDPAGEPP